MKIEHTTYPSNRGVEFLSKKIGEETASKRTYDLFAFFIHNGARQIIAGCSGFTIYGSIYTDVLWVHHDYRKKVWESS